MPEVRACVFCEGTPLTREHVYPQWLAASLPDQLPYRGQRTSVVYLPEDSDFIMPNVFREVGQEFTQTVVKRTCESCNSGWMNDLERQVRKTLTMMIQGNAFVATMEDSESLATWVAKTCLMAQFTHPESLAMPQAYIDWIYSTRSPPPNMHIWAIPTRTEDWGVRMEHRGYLFNSDAKVDSSDPCNTHCTVIGLGYVAFWILGSTRSSLFPSELINYSPPTAVRLWPQGSSFKWKPQPCLGDMELRFLVDFLNEEKPAD